jgi:LysR family transcriptional regulator (chromosome initiation inhibitor)
MHYVAVASSAFVQARCAGGVATAHQLLNLPYVAFNRKDDLQADFVARACGLPQVVLTQLFVPSTEGQVQAALDGWGVTVVPELKVQPLLADGRLVNVWPSQRLPVALYWHCWNLDSGVLRTLSQALAQTAQGVLSARSG